MENKVILPKEYVMKYVQFCEFVKRKLKEDKIERLSLYGMGQNGLLLFGILQSIGVRVESLFDDAMPDDIGQWPISPFCKEVAYGDWIFLTVDPDSKAFKKMEQRLIDNGFEYYTLNDFIEVVPNGAELMKK